MFVDFIHEIFPSKQCINLRLQQTFHGIAFTCCRERFAGIEPPAEAKAEKNYAAREQHQSQRFALEQSAERKWFRVSFEEALEPRPRRSSDKTKQNRKSRQKHERSGHDPGTFVRSRRQLDVRMFLRRNARMRYRLLVGVGCVAKFQSVIAKENVENLAGQ